jgi:hypothetical protein
MPTMLLTKGEVIEKTRNLREELRVSSPRVKAGDIALGIYDAFTFTENLTRIFVIDALTFIARTIIQRERHLRERREHASAGAAEDARGTAEFPQFEDICRECPRNYALPGDSPENTVYVETFDDDFENLPDGFEYLQRHGQAEIRHADALRSLYRLCQRLGGNRGETPREILRRHGYDAGDD